MRNRNKIFMSAKCTLAKESTSLKRQLAEEFENFFLSLKVRIQLSKIDVICFRMLLVNMFWFVEM